MVEYCVFQWDNEHNCCFSKTLWCFTFQLFCFVLSLQSLVTWQGNKLVCEQIGEKKNRGWTHWIEDDRLHLVGI